MELMVGGAHRAIDLGTEATADRERPPFLVEEEDGYLREAIPREALIPVQQGLLGEMGV